jgi:predicted flap endonuclease-1-like 5' DNA nuclease
MTNPVHVLTVAALLLVAFLAGAIIGTLARLLALRLGRKPLVATAASVDAAPAAVPLVAAPVIAPLPVAPAPVMPALADIPVPDFAASLTAPLQAAPAPPAEAPVPDFAATLIALANEAPPAGFLEAAKPHVEPVATAGPMPEVRPMPAMAPLPVAAAAEASPAMQPAHIAGETTSGVHVAAPAHDEPTAQVEAAAEVAEPRTAEVILFPSAAAEPATGRPTDIVVGGESVAVVDASEFAEPEMIDTSAAEPVVVKAEPKVELTLAAPHEDNFLFVGGDAPAVPKTLKAELVLAPEPGSQAETIPIPVIAANAAVGAVIAAALPVPEVVEARIDRPAQPAGPVAPIAPEPAEAAEPAEPKSVVSTPLPEPIPDQLEPVAMTTPEPPAAEPATASKPQAETATPAPESEPIVVSADEPIDEDAAMRAIEGNWSPRRAPPRRPARPSAEPEGANEAVAASARAVTAARRLAESVVAEVAEVQAEAKAEAGRPDGLDAPRDGRKDDLTHIIGVLPVIETALNKLGLYHFDQVGSLTNEQISWIEGHLGVPGRISRELWREQARELSAVLRPKRVAEK